MDAHKNVIAELRRRAGDSWQEYDLVFPARFGSHIWQDGTQRVFRKICEELGWEKGKYSLYSLRHTMATLAIHKNVNLKVVSERLGHASMRTTADIYTHLTPALQATATEEIGEILYE